VGAAFAQTGASHVHDQLDVIAGMLGRLFPNPETLLRLAGAVLVRGP
jgi:hypothetical protein